MAEDDGLGLVRQRVESLGITTADGDDLIGLFLAACDSETTELTAAAHASLELVPRPFRRTVMKVAGL